jgi:hypothetical protein
MCSRLTFNWVNRIILKIKDKDIDEVVTILQTDIPKAKQYVLKILQGQKETKQGIKTIQAIRSSLCS